MSADDRVGPALIPLIALCCALLLAGCGAGSGSGSSGNNILVTITNKATSVQAGTGSIVFTATVQNDSSNSGVTWSLTASGLSCSPLCGTLTQATSTTVTYSPPSTAPAGPTNQPTLTATSVAKTNKSDSDAFSITAALTVTITNVFSSVNAGTSPFVVNATVQNDPTNSGVSWTLTACASCGTLSSGTTSNVTYAPPGSVPQSIDATLTATSVHDTSKSASLNFTIQQPAIVVSIQNKISSVFAGSQSVFIAATVSNDSSGSISWQLIANGTTCTASTCGTLSPAGSQSIIYNPPSSAPSAPFNTPTLTATSNTDPTKSDSDTFTISPAPPISVTVTPVSSVVAGSTGGVNFSANVRNDFSNPPQGVTWMLTVGGSACAASACGSLTNQTATSVTYTPPATAPSTPNNRPTLTATSVADPTKSGSDTFTITSSVANNCGAAGGSESILKSHYAMLLQGFAGSGSGNPILIAASFAADGSGGISGGEEDINDTVAPQHLTFDSTTGRSLYTVGADHRGCLQLTNTGGTTAVFRFALAGINAGIASKGRIIEFDDNSGTGTGSRGSGVLKVQDSNSFVLTALQNQYAFGVDGWGTENNQIVHFNMAGSFSTNSSGNLSGVYDDNFAGITAPESTGRPGQINSISASTGQGTGSFDFLNWAIYMVNSSEFFVVSTDPISSTVSAGRAIATGNSFTANSLSGSYIVHSSGSTNSKASVDVELLTMTPGGAQTGTLSGTVNSYGGGNGLQTTALSGVTYNVDPATGRVALGNPSDNLPILYLTTPTDGISAFLIGMSGDAQMGLVEFQPNQTYSTASVAGTYFFGTEDPDDNTVNDELGAETIANTGSASGTLDLSGTAGLQPGLPFNATLTINANGTGNLGAQTVAITNGTKIFYIDETNGAIVVAEQ